MIDEKRIEEIREHLEAVQGQCDDSTESTGAILMLLGDIPDLLHALEEAQLEIERLREAIAQTVSDGTITVSGVTIGESGHIEPHSESFEIRDGLPVLTVEREQND